MVTIQQLACEQAHLWLTCASDMRAKRSGGQESDGQESFSWLPHSLDVASPLSVAALPRACNPKVSLLAGYTTICGLS